jgi:hypothetical protein
MYSYAYEYAEPPFDEWEDKEKEIFIFEKVKEVCENIVKRGDKSNYPEAFDGLYLYIEQNIEKFLPEVCHD